MTHSVNTPGIPDLGWAANQRTLVSVGTGLSLLALAAAKIADQPGVEGYGFRLMSWIAAVVLLVCCGVNAWCWHSQLRQWRSGGDEGYQQRRRLSLIAHLVSYAAVLVGMFSAIEGSALAGFASGAGTLDGIAFILMIFGQIFGGTQYLRRSGPPGTVPTYLRRLNAKVQSLR
ncbi:hypothetical protein [Microlunatus sp. Gsoil 973]|uniref:hypothetical protein n=1 Tax=Microlunatus sp. Gsoil 973 TaxID=2672569 RepID=UPI0012B48BD5|nr:hypothetical protein [Microlunatus sp. Gsoil 973]QGN33791.1 hypothetical protein GJV80_14275 [Microlunatus sp. Gsoil 973]